MTEEEGKTKWCPQAGVSRFNRQDELCLASDCMAWRLTRPYQEWGDFRPDEIPEGWSATGDEGFAPDEVECVREIPSTGYCGFAGGLGGF